MQSEVGGILHLKLNIDTRPIANKYREGKMKSTLEGGSKEGVKPLICKRVVWVVESGCRGWAGAAVRGSGTARVWVCARRVCPVEHARLLCGAVCGMRGRGGA